MPRYLQDINGSFEWRKPTEPGITHVLMSVEEYNKVRKEVQRLTDENNLYSRGVKPAGDIEDQTDYLDIAKILNDYGRLDSFNRRLIEINNERCNATRELQPKKEHSGYIVIKSSEREYYDRSMCVTTTYWQTELQIPQRVTTIARTARNILAEDLLQNSDMSKLKKIGIDEIHLCKLEECSRTNKNTIYAYSLRANYLTGFWEVILYHTKPLGIVPKEFLVMPKKKKKNT